MESYVDREKQSVRGEVAKYKQMKGGWRLFKLIYGYGFFNKETDSVIEFKRAYWIDKLKNVISAAKAVDGIVLGEQKVTYAIQNG